ncbi:MAG: AbrB/MazE/SpoVT family DNA-binding domain-containing protein [Candidatus Hodarchaeaceae archaeon]|nr:AbrB/MazE/SpoVT family DNA-binding domain-containing protein [Candidatus Hodarchaeaceae archaeon]
MTSVVDGRGRVVLPRHVTEALELSEGDMIAFEKVEDHFVIRKVRAPERKLEEIMSWNPKRIGKPEPVSPKEMKEIWKS